MSHPNNAYDLYKQAIIEQQRYDRAYEKCLIQQMAAEANQKALERIKKREEQPFVDEHNLWVTAEESYNTAYETTQSSEQLAAEKAQRRQEEQRKQAAAQARNEQRQAEQVDQLQKKHKRAQAAVAQEEPAQENNFEKFKNALLPKRFEAILRFFAKNPEKNFLVINSSLKEIELSAESTDKTVTISPGELFPSELDKLHTYKKNLFFNGFKLKIISFNKKTADESLFRALVCVITPKNELKIFSVKENRETIDPKIAETFIQYSLTQ